MNHGDESATVRHYGDFGNIVADPAGLASISISGFQESIAMLPTISGRALVRTHIVTLSHLTRVRAITKAITADVDDLGLGGDVDSLTDGTSTRMLTHNSLCACVRAGHSGPVVACCNIVQTGYTVITPPPTTPKPPVSTCDVYSPPIAHTVFPTDFATNTSTAKQRTDTRRVDNVGVNSDCNRRECKKS
jgi:hypothetical protein